MTGAGAGRTGGGGSGVVLAVLVEPGERDASRARPERAWRAPLAAGRRLSELLGLPLEVMVIGPAGTTRSLEAEPGVLAGAARVVVSEAGREAPAADRLASGVARVARERGARAVVTAHDYVHLGGLAALAAALDAAMVAGAVAVDRAEDGGLLWSRPAFEGKLVERLAAAPGTPMVATVRADGFAGVAGGPPAGSGRPPEMEVGTWPEEDPRAGSPGGVEWLGDEAGEGGAGLGDARRIVAVGRGLGDPERLGPIRELAAALDAELAGSRPVIDAGWLPRERQVGSSGATVAPDLYLALGISGSAQHLAGISTARCVVAVNKDPEAPIFRVARFGVVADLHALAPALRAALADETET